MPHNIQDVEIHHAGDTHTLAVTVKDTDGDVQDLTGASAEWYLKEDNRTTDANAELSKTGEESVSETEINFTDPVNGKLEVNIENGDTGDLIDWSTYSQESKTFYHVLRITDNNNNRSTAFTGDFIIYPS